MAMNIRTMSFNPELNIAFFSFVFHFVWEFIQIPTYAGMTELNHWQGVLVCSQATIGDVGIALMAYWTTCLVARSRYWISNPSRREIVVFLLVGISITILLEYIYTQVTHRWTYSDLMPLVPPFNTGLSPLLQWVTIPLLVMFVVRRQIRS